MVSIARCRLIRILALLTVLVVNAEPAAAQGETITVEVRSGGRPVKDVKVSVYGDRPGQLLEEPVTDDLGTAKVSNLRVGIYTVNVEGTDRYGAQTLHVSRRESNRVVFNLDELPLRNPRPAIQAAADRQRTGTFFWFDNVSPSTPVPEIAILARREGSGAIEAAAVQQMEREAAVVQRQVHGLEDALSRQVNVVLDQLPVDAATQLRTDLAAARTPADKQAAVQRAGEHPTMEVLRMVDRPSYTSTKRTLDAVGEWFGRLGERQTALSGLRASLDQVRRAEGPRGSWAPPFPGSSGFGPGAPAPGVPGFYASGGTGAAFITDLPRLQYGTLVIVPGVAGSEQAIVETDSEIVGWRLALGVDVPVSRAGSVSAEFAYRQAEADASASVPVGSTSVAIVYFDQAPNGVRAIGLGSTGADVEVESTFSKIAFYARYSHDVGDLFGARSDRWQVRAGAGLGFQRIALSHDASQTSPTFTGIRSDAEIDSQTIIVGPRFDLGLAYRWDLSRPVSLGIDGYVVPGVAFGSGTAEQHNRCDLCAAPQRDFTVERESDRSDFGLIAGFTGRVGVSLTDRLQLGVEGGWERTGTVYSWQVPISPLEQPARLEQKSADVGFVGVYVRWAF
jgi:hypothetical protein